MSGCRPVRLCSDAQRPWAGVVTARGASNSQPPSFSRGAKAAAAKHLAALKACSLLLTRTEIFQLFMVGNTESRRENCSGVSVPPHGHHRHWCTSCPPQPPLPPEVFEPLFSWHLHVQFATDTSNFKHPCGAGWGSELQPPTCGARRSPGSCLLSPGFRLLPSFALQRTIRKKKPKPLETFKCQFVVACYMVFQKRVSNAEIHFFFFSVREEGGQQRITDPEAAQSPRTTSPAAGKV